MGAWTPMTISLSVTPSRSCGRQAAETGTARMAASERSRSAVGVRRKGVDDRAVMVVGQQFHRLGDRKPTDLIDLRVGGEAAVAGRGLHGPVADGLRTAL